MERPHIQIETHGKLEFRRREQFAWDGSKDTKARAVPDGAGIDSYLVLECA